MLNKILTAIKLSTKTNKIDPNLKISQNFYMSELIQSSVALRLGIDNTPTPEYQKNLIEATKKLWQPTRTLLGKSMLISSGYRSPKLNDAVGGSDSSAHSFGFAIDFTSPSFGNTRKIAEFLVKELKRKNIKFDQLILEFPDSPSSWIHLGYKSQTGQQRGQVLTAKKIDGKTRYLVGLV